MKKFAIMLFVIIMIICAFTMFACDEVQTTNNTNNNVVNNENKTNNNNNNGNPIVTPDDNNQDNNEEEDVGITYNISFYDENGVLLTTKEVKENVVPSYNYTKVDTAEWDYTIEGWATTQDGDVLPSLAPATENTSYYAIVSSVKKQYTISFNSNGGSAVASITRDYNTSVLAPSEPKKDGYVFVAWCTDATLNTAVSWPVNVTGNVTYYAKWIEIKHEIKFYDENGTLLITQQVKENAVPSYNYTKADTVEWDYTFEGWATTQDGDVLSSLAPATENTSYYAIVSSIKKQYTISFNSNGGSAVASITRDYGTSVTAPSEPTKDGYAFVSWCTDSTLNTAVSWPVAITSNKTFYAKWQETIYNISFYDENGVLLTTKEVKENDVPSYNYTKVDTAEWDYTVEGWATTQDGDVLSSLAPATENTSYYAIVSSVKKQYTISFNSNGGSAVASITRDYNTSVAAPSEPTKDGYAFVSWCTDSTLNTAVSWPVTVTGNVTYYAKWNEKVDMKGYLSSLKSALIQDPYSYIPDTMRPTNTSNYVSEQDVTYDFTTFTNVNNIKYGGYGEQWQMVVDNVSQSEKFYTVFSLADTAITASVVAFNNWFDNNPSSTNKDIDETGYYASVEFSKGTLYYTLQLKTNYTIPMFGQAQPLIEMEYEILSGDKSVKVSLTSTNVMRYIITENTYKFAIEYGINNVNRTAYFEITKTKDTLEGHIYEYITALGKDAVKSCADFYITDDYTSVVGNKASGIVLMDGYITELYNTETGKLLGYKVQESKTILGITATYNTLWFNLNSISGISSVKAIANGSTLPNENKHDVYVNGNSSIFTPTYNTKGIGSLKKNTSRKYDIEMRTQYFYNEVDGKLVCYEVEIPMMFIQDGDNYDSFTSDMTNTNGINATVNVSNTVLTQIRTDYVELIPVFITNKEEWNSEVIIAWIEE